jgi:urease accessory protein
MALAVVQPPTDAKGWAASLFLRYAVCGDRTALIERRHRGPLTVQRPFYPEKDGPCHTYLLHPPAGIVGGDDLEIVFELEADTNALVTTPGATRWYYSDARLATSTQTAHVATGATLEWLPQETLLFDGANAKLTTRIELQGDAGFLGWEILGFGRPACGETFDNGTLDFRFELWRDSSLLLRERLCSKGRPAGLNEHAALMTLVACHADNSALVDARQVCEGFDDILCAPTLIGDLLICRGLAQDCAPLSILARELWRALRPQLLGREAVPPRIWQT